MDFKSQAIDLVEKMNLEQKVRLFTTNGFGRIEEVKELGIPCAHIAEGMSKLRLSEKGVSEEIPGLIPSIDFPVQNLLACSFDPNLLEEIGNAMGEECLEHKIDMLIAPYVNVNRNPMRGNGENYFSEDPYLNGKLGAAFVNGLQKTGVAACIPSFGADCRAYHRSKTNSIIDRKTLEEIYLRPFEMLVKEAQPAAMMMAEGKLNGTKHCESEELMTRIARQQWDYKGIFLSGFGTVTDSARSIESGLDLEIPGTGKDTEKVLLKAIQEGDFSEQKLDEAVTRIVGTLLRMAEDTGRSVTRLEGTSELAKLVEKKKFVYDRAAHRKLAWKAAQESAVLLKNNGILPLVHKKNIAIIGALAKYPRFSQASVDKNDDLVASPYQVFKEYGYSFGYADGYLLEKDEPNDEMLQEACSVADGREAVIVFLGMPVKNRSEKKHMLIPENQMHLLDAVLQRNRNVIVVVQNDGVFRLPQIQKIGAVLLMGIAGEQCGRACVNILSGQANPCGKLAETIPNSFKDVPSYHYLINDDKCCQYREGIFVGYRFYDTARRNVMFPFGYGLSYTTYEYGNMEIDRINCNLLRPEERVVHIDIPITNTGEYDGKEIVQLYIRKKKSVIFHEDKVLRGVTKIFIPKGETRMASFELTNEDFMTYSMLQKQFEVENGIYEILIGSNSRNILKSVEIKVIATEKDVYALMGDQSEKNRENYPTYYHFPEGEFTVSDSEFERLFQEQNITFYEERVITVESSLREVQMSFWGNFVVKNIFKRLKKKEDTFEFPSVVRNTSEILDMPIYQVCVLYTDFSKNTILGFIDICNHRFLQGIRKLL